MPDFPSSSIPAFSKDIVHFITCCALGRNDYTAAIIEPLGGVVILVIMVLPIFLL